MLQPCHRFRIEMIGRFIQQKHIRLFEQKPAERNAPPLSAGDDIDRRLRRRTPQSIHSLFQLTVQVPRLQMIDFFLKFGLFFQKFVIVRIRFSKLLVDRFVLF